MGIERHDRATAEIAHQQLVCMRTERAGRKSQTPGRIHLGDSSAGSGACGEALECPRDKLEYVDQASSPARCVVRLRGVLFCECDEDDALEILHVKRSVPCRSRMVRILPHELRIAIINIQSSFMEIG